MTIELSATTIFCIGFLAGSLITAMLIIIALILND